jgi:hypothetical protein
MKYFFKKRTKSDGCLESIVLSIKTWIKSGINTFKTGFFTVAYGKD